jgi:hypothetical protein
MKSFAIYVVSVIGEREFGEWLIVKEKTKAKALRKIMDHYESFDPDMDDEEAKPEKFNDDLTLEQDFGEMLIKIKGVHEFKTLKDLLKLLPSF